MLTISENIKSTHTNLREIEKILKDPIFTPGLKQRIEEVRELNTDLNDFLDGVINGVHRSAVVYGPPGLGKTHSTVKAIEKSGLKEGKDYYVVRSHATPLQLYQTLYFMRARGKMVVLDDCDGVLTNETGLNLLKAATDNTFRTIGWHSSASIVSATGKSVPSSFTFDGSLIIITNVRLASGKGRLSNHWDALRSRMPGFHLNLDNRADQYAQVFYATVDLDYLSKSPDTKLGEEGKIALLKFFLNNLDVPRRLDLRMPETVAREMIARPDNWERRAKRILESA